LLMDQDDPDQRVADLEGRLATQRRGADLPPASPDHAAGSRQFVALPLGRGVGLTLRGLKKLGLAYVAVALVAVVPAMVSEAMAASIPLESSARTAIEMGWMFGAFVVVVVSFLAFRWRRRRKIAICVTSDGLTVNQRRGAVYLFTDVKLGAWGPGSLTVGTALHLHRGPDSLVVGGRDYRLAAGIRLDAPPVDCPDAWMSASDFGELLTVVGRRSQLDVRGPALGEPIRCLLFPYEVLVAVTSWGFGEKLPFSSPPKPRLVIDVGKDEIRVIDPTNNALKASARPGRVTATAKNYVQQLPRSGTWTIPVLVLGVPDLPSMTIGCQEGTLGLSGNRPRFPWSDFGTVQDEKPPRYLVTGRDWLTLVEKFGLAPHLEQDESG
jgi:hypothetical protein